MSPACFMGECGSVHRWECRETKSVESCHGISYTLCRTAQRFVGQYEIFILKIISLSVPYRPDGMGNYRLTAARHLHGLIRLYIIYTIFFKVYFAPRFSSLCDVQSTSRKRVLSL